MKAKKAITSLIASAMMLSAVPVNVYADNEPSIPEWVFSDIYFSPDGSKGYNFVEYRGKGNDITIPTEYNGIPVKFVEPMDFVITWKEYNPETEELTVHVPEGIDFKERSYSSYAQDYYTLSDWAGDRFNTQNFRATFIEKWYTAADSADTILVRAGQQGHGGLIYSLTKTVMST